MQNTTRLDIIPVLLILLVVALQEGLAAITLLEVHLAFKCLHLYSHRRRWLQEGIRCGLMEQVDHLGLDVDFAIAEVQFSLLVLKTFERSLRQTLCHQRQTLLDECGARTLGTSLTYHRETLTGSRKRYVEQVQIVNGVLQVFLQIVAFIDRPHHVLLTIVDGRDGKIVEGRLCRTAPKHIARLL